MEVRAHVSDTADGGKRLFVQAWVRSVELESAALTVDGFRALLVALSADVKRALDVWRQSEYSKPQDGDPNGSV